MLVLICFGCFRVSEDLCVILPSLNDVKEAFSMATSWLENAKPFLASCYPLLPALNSLLPLKFEALQVLANLFMFALHLKILKALWLTMSSTHCRTWLPNQSF